MSIFKRKTKEEKIIEIRSDFFENIELESVDVSRCKLGHRGSVDVLCNFIPDIKYFDVMDVAELLEQHGYIKIYSKNERLSYKVNPDHNIYNNKLFFKIKNQFKDAAIKAGINTNL